MKKVWILLVALCLMMTAVLGVVSVSAADVVYGDVDGNGKVTNRDLAQIQQYITGWIGDADLDIVAADVDGNGKVTNRDLAQIQQYITGWIDHLGPVEPDVPADDNMYNDVILPWD